MSESEFSGLSKMLEKEEKTKITESDLEKAVKNLSKSFDSTYHWTPFEPEGFTEIHHQIREQVISEFPKALGSVQPNTALYALIDSMSAQIARIKVAPLEFLDKGVIDKMIERAISTVLDNKEDKILGSLLNRIDKKIDEKVNQELKNFALKHEERIKKLAQGFSDDLENL